MKAVEGWKRESLGDQLELIRNGYSGQQVDHFTDFPVSRIETISDGSIDINRVGYVDFIPDSYLLKAGDLLISNINSLKHIGKVAQVGEGIRLFHGMNLLVLRPVEQVDQKFLFYKLINAKPWFEKMAAQAINQASINQVTIRELQLDLPQQKPEQTKIAEILSTVDRAIEQTEALIAKQQRIKTGLMQDLLTRGIDEHGNLRSEQTHQFKDSPLGRIPVEWNPSQISSAATLQRGHDITENDLRNGPYPVISSGGVIGYHAECTSKSPNVVVGRKGTIGRVHYLEHDFWAHDTSLYVTNFKGNNEQYIFYLFSHLDLARYGTKSGSPSLNRNDIHPLWIGLPSPDEQGMIAAILKRCDLGLDSLGRRSEKLRAIKTALMQDLLTGKKRVTVLLNSSMPTN
jgi:type I restriction enzyme, S subunit